MIRSVMLALLLVTSASAMADNEARTVSVNGTGSAEAIPDRAYLRMSIVAREPTLAAAQKKSGSVTAKVLAMTDRLKVDRKRVDTTGASVRPDYRWNRDREEQELRGYIAERQITVDVRDLEKLAELVEGAVSAGVNQVSPPQLDSSKRRQAYREALDNAAADARSNAEQLAKSLGMKLGPVMQVNAGANYPPSPAPQVRAMAMAAEGDAMATYNAGDLSFNTTISVIFELTAD